MRNIFIFIVMIYSTIIFAQTTIRVPDDYATIQAALNIANEGDTVFVVAGTYIENIIWPETNGIKLIGQDSSNTIIHGGNIKRTVFIGSSIIDSSTIFQGFKITGAKGDGLCIYNCSPQLNLLRIEKNASNSNGGGLYIKNSNPIMTNITINSNTSEQGAGIYLENSNPIMMNMKIYSNVAKYYGGGLYMKDSNPTMTNIAIYSNKATLSAGGIYLRDSDPIIENSAIYSNISSTDAGGVSLFFSNPTITNVTIHSNETSSNGGGIYLMHSKPTITDVTIYLNKAGLNGGGIYYEHSGSTLSNTSVYSNVAKNGGGIYLESSSPKMLDVIVSSNRTEQGQGGGIHFSSSTPTMTHVTVHTNSAAYGGGIYCVGKVTINSGLNVVENHGFYGGGIYIEKSSEVTIKQINIINNSTYTSEGNGIYIKDGATIERCNFANSSYSVYHAGNYYTICVDSWFNNITGPYHEMLNPNGLGDTVSTYLNIRPWATEPNIDAPPIPAQNLEIINSSNTSIEIQWLSSKMSDFSSYKIYYDTDSSGYPYSNSINVGSDTSYALTGLNPNTKYYIAVTTTDTDGNESWYSQEVNATPFNTPSTVTLSSPLNNSQGLVKPIKIKWYKGNNTDYYTVEIAKDTLFNDIIFGRNINKPDTTYQVDSLKDLTNYFWRVKGTNAYASGDWSEIWSFKTLGKPTTVTQIMPVANAENQPIELEFKWTVAKDQFHSQISNHVNYTTKRKKIFTSTIANKKAKTIKSISNYWFELNLSPTSEYAFVDSTLADTAVVFYGFENSTEYYWRIRAKNQTGWGAFAEWSKFTTIVDTPTVVMLQSPLNNSTGNIKPIEFKWYKSNLAKTYALQLSTASDFTTTLFDSVDITDTSFTANNLADLTKYYWRVKAKNIGGETEWSEVWNFSTLGEPTDGVQLYPIANAINQPIDVNFIWKKAKDKLSIIKGDNVLSVSNYWFELSNDTTKNSFIVDSTLVDTTKFVSDLTNRTSYYWKIKAKNELGWGNPSRWSKFTTIVDTPVDVTLKSPLNNDENVSKPISLIWNKSALAENYTLQVSLNSVFGSSVIDSSGITDTSFTVNSLDNSTKYFWRIKANNIGGESTWSDVWSFTTLGVPTAPTLILPENDLELADTTNNIEFVWSSVDMIDSYTLEASANENFDSLFVSINDLTDTNYIYSNQLIPGIFYWRVNAKNLAGIGDWSNIYSFTITLTDVDRLGNIIPQEYVLHQNYPNPFNPSTMVKYGLPEQSNIKIEIFNMLGQSVGVLVNAEKSAGLYETTWNADNLPSGIYLINIRAEGLSSKKSFVQVKKALLLK